MGKRFLRRLLGGFTTGIFVICWTVILTGTCFSGGKSCGAVKESGGVFGSRRATGSDAEEIADAGGRMATGSDAEEDLEIEDDLELEEPGDATPSIATPSVMPAPSSGGYDELVRWLEDENREDTTFTLTEDIRWEERKYFRLEEAAVIDTAEHTITIPSGGVFRIQGAGVTIMGGFGEKPMFAVESGGALLLDQAASVRVSDGVGVAIEGKVSSGSRTECYVEFTFTDFSVEGEGAVGIRGERSLDFSRLNMETGEGAVGIDAQGDVSLFLSEIRGEGESIRASGNVVLDGCAVNTVPEGAVLRERTFQPLESDQTDIFIWPGRELPAYANYEFRGQGQETELIKVRIWYDAGEADLQTPGVYRAAVVPEQLPFESACFELPESRGLITVMEESQRYIKSIQAAKDSYYLILPKNKEEGELLELFSSADGGKTWDPWEVKYPYWEGSRFQIEGTLELNQEYLFVAVFTLDERSVESNLISVRRTEDSVISKGVEGRRDDSSRDDGKPEPEKPGSDGNNGGDGSGSQGENTGGNAENPGNTAPGTGNEPGSGNTAPGTGNEPGSGNTDPGTGDEPGSGNTDSGTGNKSGSGSTDSGKGSRSGSQIPETGPQIPEIGLKIPETGSGIPKSGSGSIENGFDAPKTGTRGQTNPTGRPSAASAAEASGKASDHMESPDTGDFSQPGSASGDSPADIGSAAFTEEVGAEAAVSAQEADASQKQSVFSEKQALFLLLSAAFFLLSVLGYCIIATLCSRFKAKNKKGGHSR